MYHGYGHWLYNKETNGRSQALTEKATRAMRLGISCSFPGFSEMKFTEKEREKKVLADRITRSSYHSVA